MRSTCPQLRAFRSVLTGGVPGCKVRAFFELDNEATVEVSVTLRYLAIHSASLCQENGIDDGATLMVQLLKGVPFNEANMLAS